MFVPVHALPLVARFGAILLRPDDEMSIVNDALHAIIFDTCVHVALRVDKHLLFFLGVIKAQFIKANTALSGIRLDTTQLVIVWVLIIRSLPQIRRHLISVINTADNNRLIGIALEEIDDNLLTDARPKKGPPTLTGPGLGHAHPARTVGVVLSLPIPVELHLYATVFVSKNLFTRRTYSNVRLRSIRHGLPFDRCGPQRK